MTTNLNGLVLSVFPGADLASRRLRLLDLFCGAGGAARGYQRAGFCVLGVDVNPQPRYAGCQFVQTDALEYVAEHGHEYDAIHASPPCQGYSIMRNLPWLKDREYPMLIDPVRELLEQTARPWVIENVMGAHLSAGWLCGTMFGLPFYRHRAFATSFFWLQPGHPRHLESIRPGHSLAGRAREIVFAPRNGIKGGVGHTTGWKAASEAMGIDWMKQGELTQAIPPAYTEFIGRALASAIRQATRGSE